MKKFGLVMVAVAVASFALAGGCGGKTEEKPAADGGAKPAAAPKALTPKETVEAFCKSFTADGKKWETAKPMLTKKAQEFMDLLQKVEEGEKDGPNILSFEAKDEKIDGEKATVTIKSKEKSRSGEEREKDETFHLRKEDGSWKIFGIGDGEGANFEDEKNLEEMRDAVKMMEDMKKKDE